ncbi:MAG: AmmeMemoRadiSam system radical SAM enzyme [Myxococcota bacterium]|nr:AmmeMemoRadiSam system radical SAM enzyme [Myxococcota bacterium]MEE2780143.1 AmmeMemoRadiSam system radical SAM enzyme [Myxococcota bacterium]
MTTLARYWHRHSDGRIQCDLCPRHCRLNDGQRAFCFVRAREGDELVLTTYGRSTGFCIDPIEKKPLNHFLPGTPVLSFGTAGCNLGCKFCQNWDISKAREIERLSDLATPEGIAEAALKSGCRSVAFTYNDPVIWAEYAMDTARACKEVGVRSVAVTAGYITEEARGDFFHDLDAVNVDLKAFTQTFYKRLCFADLQPVLDTLEWLVRETEVWLEVTTLIIPGQNDSDEELKRLCGWYVEHLGPDVPIHFSAFHPDYKMMDVPRTPPETLRQARRLALAEGLRYVYTGNVHDKTGDATRCPSCDALLVQRDWYTLLEWNLDDGHCGSCGHVIAGVFEAQPGTWGAKRQRVRVS